MDLTTTPAVLDATKLDDYTRLRDAARALAGAAAGVVLWEGGDLDAFETSTVEVTLRKAWGDAGVEVDGTYLPLLATIGGSVFLEVVARRVVGGAAVTCTVDLYNVTTGAQVAGSAVAISLTTDNETKQKSGAITLASGVNSYRARIKSSTGTDVAARARVVAKGA
jgi:hypothetical protein